MLLIVNIYIYMNMSTGINVSMTMSTNIIHSIIEQKRSRRNKMTETR